jgi:hypothetical protein
MQHVISIILWKQLLKQTQTIELNNFIGDIFSLCIYGQV